MSTQIQISCPHCGNEQHEPSQVVSCYCKACRKHLDLQRDHVRWERINVGKIDTVLDRFRSVFGRKSQRHVLPPAPVSGPRLRKSPFDEAAENAASAVIAATPSPARAVSTEKTPSEIQATPTPAKDSSSAKSNSKPKAGSKKATPVVDPPAVSERPNTPGQGRAPLFRSERSLKCFACSTTFHAPKIGPAPACPACGEQFSSTDKVIENSTDGKDFFTYGNVRLLSRGIIDGPRFGCHHLAAYGKIGGDINCSGRVECNVSGKMNASVRCRELIIPRKVSVEFTGIIEADHIDVQGEITARALVNGDLTIGSGGIFNGEVITRTMSVEDDAELNAAVQIDTDPASMRPDLEKSVLATK